MSKILSRMSITSLILDYFAPGKYLIDESLWKTEYIILGGLSIMGCIYVSILYKVNAATRNHPALLIVAICIFDAICCYHMIILAIDPKDVTEYLGLNWMGGQLLFDNYQTEEVSQMLCNSNNVMYTFFEYSSVLLNCCLCLDLSLTLRNPFENGKKRNIYYFLLSILTPAIFVWFLREDITKPCRQNSDIRFVHNPMIGLFVLLFIILGFSSIFHAYHRMSTGYSITNEQKKLFKRKHIYYVYGLMFVWIWSVISAFIFFIESVMQDWPSEDIVLNSYSTPQKLFNELGIIIPLSSGIWIFFLRLSEPYFITLTKYTVLSCCGCRSLSPQREKQRKALLDKVKSSSYFLGSSLNTELVHTMLKGLCEILQGGNERKLRRVTNNMLRQESRHYIDRMQLANPKEWNLIMQKKEENPQPRKTSTAKGALVEGVIGMALDVAKKEKIKQKRADGDFFGDEFTMFEQEEEGDKTVGYKKKKGEYVKVIEYAPIIFQNIRKMDKWSENDVKKSLNPILNKSSIFSAGESQGKSGSFFFFSLDKKFLIKTMSNEEKSWMLKMLKDYYEHIGRHPKSLLARIYGIFTFKVKGIVPINILIMENSIQAEKEHIWHIFDLKGSTVNREVHSDHNKPTEVLKDINFLKISRQHDFMQMFEQDKENLLSIIDLDTQILQPHKYMDYSLLIAVALNPALQINTSNFDLEHYDWEEVKERIDPETLREFCASNRNMFASTNGVFIYHISIIDYLQYFHSPMKILEYRWKSMKRLGKMEGVSAVAPDIYAKRFLNFIRAKVVRLDVENEDSAK